MEPLDALKNTAARLIAVSVCGESCGYSRKRTGVRMKPPPAPTIVPKAPTQNPIATRRAATSGENCIPQRRYVTAASGRRCQETRSERCLGVRAAQHVHDALGGCVAVVRAEL